MVDVILIGDEESPEINLIWDKLRRNGITPLIYPSLFDARWVEELKFCFCGCPDEAQEYLKGVLDALEKRSEAASETMEDWDNATKDLGNALRGEGVGWFCLYVLAALGLTAHGGSVNGAWLSAKGQTLLAELRSALAGEGGA